MTLNRMTLKIRPLLATDRDTWQILWADYLRFYETDLDSAVYETTFSRLIADDCPAQNALVATQGGTLIGLVHYIFHPHNWRVEDVCYLQDLYVAPEHRGGGVARALIQAVYQKGDAAGAPSVYWLTQDFNTRARRLYDQIATLTPFIKYQR